MLGGDITPTFSAGNDAYPNEPNLDTLSRAAGAVAGLWTHWAFTKDCDANGMAIYINGELLANESSHLNSASYTIPIAGIYSFIIGCNASNDDAYGGLLDDFRVYDYALTQGEVCSLAGQTGTFIQPLQRLLVTSADINLTGAAIDVIDFRDYAILANTWLQTWTFGDYPDNIYP